MKLTEYDGLSYQKYHALQNKCVLKKSATAPVSLLNPTSGQTPNPYILYRMFINEPVNSSHYQIKKNKLKSAL